MKNKFKKNIFYLFLFLLLFSGFYVNSARELETTYPGATFTTTATPINLYISYIFNFAVIIATTFALLFLTLGGLNYLTSIGDPAEMQNAKKRVLSSIFGLCIIFGSWIILRIIDNYIIDIREPETSSIPTTPLIKTPSPILFCKEEIINIDYLPDESINIEIRKNILNQITNENKCIFIFGGEVINSSWRKPKVVYILPGQDKKHYGVILYAQNYEKGQVVYNLTDQVKKIVPMSELSPDYEPIFYTAPFTMIKEGTDSYSFIRRVKLYKYHDRNNLFENRQIEKEEADNNIPKWYSLTDSTASTTSEGEIGLPLKVFPWLSFKIVGSLQIYNPYSYIPKTIIIFFPPITTSGGIPSWENGETSKLVVLTEGDEKKNINLNLTEMKKWGPSDSYECKDQDAPIPCGSCDWYWSDPGGIDPYWENINNSCNPPCGECSPPPFNGTPAATETTPCPEPEEEYEDMLLPCAGGMIIISGQFGIH